MLKRISLVLMLLTVLVGIVGVKAQTEATPQSMAKYLPADADLFFAVRTDEAFLDEITDLINTVVDKVPDAYTSQLKGFDLRALLQSQVGSMEAIGVGDYAAVSASNIAVLYDQNYTNDGDVVFYGVLALTDATKFEAFFESKAQNMTRTNENGVTIYKSTGATVFVTSDAAYLTTQDALPTGDMLDSSARFSDTVSNLPEPGYNFVIYAETRTLLQGAMYSNGIPAQNMMMLSQLGIDVANLGPLALGGTVLDGKSLILDAYTLSSGAVTSSPAPIDPSFTELIPAGTSYVIQGTDLKALLNGVIDMIYSVSNMQGSTLPSRKDLNTQLMAFLGIDLDNDIIGWMGGNYVLMFESDSKPMVESYVNGQSANLNPNPRFVLIVEGDGSDKPARVAQALGTLLVAQTQNNPSAPKVELSSNADSTSVVIEDISLSPEVEVTIEIVGNQEGLFIGNKDTIDAILEGTGDALVSSASFIEAQSYILPNASVIAFADGDGWGTVISVGIVVSTITPVVTQNIIAQLQTEEGSPTPTPIPTDNLLQPLMPLIDTAYDLFSSSSVSISYAEDGSQLTRAVLTLK